MVVKGPRTLIVHADLQPRPRTVVHRGGHEGEKTAQASENAGGRRLYAGPVEGETQVDAGRGNRLVENSERTRIELCPVVGGSELAQRLSDIDGES
jgi:hypothetical protein